MHSTIAELNWGSYLKMGIAEVVAVLLSVPDESIRTIERNDVGRSCELYMRPFHTSLHASLPLT